MDQRPRVQMYVVPRYNSWDTQQSSACRREGWAPVLFGYLGMPAARHSSVILVGTLPVVTAMRP